MFSHVLEEPKPAPISAGKRPTILIIDDDEALSDVLSCRLRQQGFDATTAESGKLGLAKARSDRPALIVLDLRLPDVDGFAICEQLADSADTCAIPVIILSGMERPDILRRSRAAGCYYFVRKPYDPNALLTLIRQAIREVGSWDGPME
ncbi:MAG: response regulator [Pirellulales bacterium]|nr:response regulator [Pirellulales bacterium]